MQFTGISTTLFVGSAPPVNDIVISTERIKQLLKAGQYITLNSDKFLTRTFKKLGLTLPGFHSFKLKVTRPDTKQSIVILGPDTLVSCFQFPSPRKNQCGL